MQIKSLLSQTAQGMIAAMRSMRQKLNTNSAGVRRKHLRRDWKNRALVSGPSRVGEPHHFGRLPQLGGIQLHTAPSVWNIFQGDCHWREREATQGKPLKNALGYRLASSTKRCFCLYGTMADVYRTALVPHTTEQMFDLVNDVAEYPDFLPWCGGVEIFRQDECHLEARVNIHLKGIRQHFTTRNTLQRPTRIEMVFLDGPFRKFTGYWHLTPLRENACKIEFALHYEFASRLLEVLIGPVFHHIADTFVEAFVRRARIKYKTPMC